MPMRITRFFAFATTLLVVACASPPAAPPAAPAAPVATRPPSVPAPVQAGPAGAAGEEIGRNARLVLYRAAAGDTWEGIARRFLGSADKSWWVAEANDGSPARGRPCRPWCRWCPSTRQACRPIATRPCPSSATTGFGPGNSKMVISQAQLRGPAGPGWLRNGYTVIRLADLAGFPGRTARRCRGVRW
jgi:hypothetical protein